MPNQFADGSRSSYVPGEAFSLINSFKTDAYKRLSFSKIQAKLKRLLKKKGGDPIIANLLLQLMKLPSSNNYHSKLVSACQEYLSKLNQMTTSVALNGAKKVPKGGVVLVMGYNQELVQILKEANKDKYFHVLIPESRPSLEGNKLMNKLKFLKNVSIFPDAGLRLALKDSDLLLIGAHAVNDRKIIGPLGCELAAEVAKNQNVPIYAVASNLRKGEVFDYHTLRPVDLNKSFRLDCYERVCSSLLSGIISEFGVMSFDKFLNFKE